MNALHFCLLAQQQLDPVKPDFWKQFCICLLVILGVAFSIVGIWALLRKPEPVKLKDSPPIEVSKAPKRFNHDLAEQRYAEHTRRLDGHEAEIEQLWQTMRNEDASIRKEMGAKFDAILLSLGEIKGELKAGDRHQK